ncbi:unnamed protein product [Caretta caretta]
MEIIHAAFLNDLQFQYFYFRGYCYTDDKLLNAADEEGRIFFQQACEGMKGCVADALCLLGASSCGLADNEILHILNILGCADECKVETPCHCAAFRNSTTK